MKPDFLKYYCPMDEDYKPLPKATTYLGKAGVDLLGVKFRMHRDYTD